MVLLVVSCNLGHSGGPLSLNYAGSLRKLKEKGYGVPVSEKDFRSPKSNLLHQMVELKQEIILSHRALKMVKQKLLNHHHQVQPNFKNQIGNPKFQEVQDEI